MLRIKSFFNVRQVTRRRSADMHTGQPALLSGQSSLLSSDVLPGSPLPNQALTPNRALQFAIRAIMARRG